MVTKGVVIDKSTLEKALVVRKSTRNQRRLWTMNWIIYNHINLREAWVPEINDDLVEKKRWRSQDMWYRHYEEREGECRWFSSLGRVHEYEIVILKLHENNKKRCLVFSVNREMCVDLFTQITHMEDACGQ